MKVIYSTVWVEFPFQAKTGRIPTHPYFYTSRLHPSWLSCDGHLLTINVWKINLLVLAWFKMNNCLEILCKFAQK